MLWCSIISASGRRKLLYGGKAPTFVKVTSAVSGQFDFAIELVPPSGWELCIFKFPFCSVSQSDAPHSFYFLSFTMLSRGHKP